MLIIITTKNVPVLQLCRVVVLNPHQQQQQQQQQQHHYHHHHHCCHYEVSQMAGPL